MKRNWRPCRLSAIGLLVLAASVRSRGAEPGIVALPAGDAGIGFDDLRYSAALGAVLVPEGRTGLLDFVDSATGKVTSVAGFSPTPSYGGGHDQGVTSVDEGSGLLFATDRTSRELLLIDPANRKILYRAKLGGPPDYVRFVAARKELWVTEPDSERIEIFRIQDGPIPSVTSAGSVPVRGGPESLVIDLKRGRAYTHLWDGKTVAVDVADRRVVATWPNGCRASRGIALDELRGFLFTGCAEGKATVLSVSDGRSLSTASSGDGVDIIDFDASSRRLYLPGGKSATMAIFAVSEDGALSLRRVVTTVTASSPSRMARRTSATRRRAGCSFSAARIRSRRPTNPDLAVAAF